jgi:hypothetical protein
MYTTYMTITIQLTNNNNGNNRRRKHLEKATSIALKRKTQRNTCAQLQHWECPNTSKKDKNQNKRGTYLWHPLAPECLHLQFWILIHERGLNHRQSRISRHRQSAETRVALAQTRDEKNPSLWEQVASVAPTQNLAVVPTGKKPLLSLIPKRQGREGSGRKCAMRTSGRSLPSLSTSLQ